MDKKTKGAWLLAQSKSLDRVTGPGAAQLENISHAVNIRREEIFHTPCRFGWDGGLGTSAYVDPAEGMIGILLTQRLMDSPEPPKVFTDFWTLAYSAMN